MSAAKPIEEDTLQEMCRRVFLEMYLNGEAEQMIEKFLEKVYHP